MEREVTDPAMQRHRGQVAGSRSILTVASPRRRAAGTASEPSGKCGHQDIVSLFADKMRLARARSCIRRVSLGGADRGRCCERTCTCTWNDIVPPPGGEVRNVSPIVHT